MSIKVRYFASLKEAMGKSDEEIPSAKEISIREIWELTNHGHQLPDNILVAVNMEYASLDDKVNEGDEVAFFPPVTGG